MILGTKSYINDNSYISIYEGDVRIGNYTAVAPNVRFVCGPGADHYSVKKRDYVSNFPFLEIGDPRNESLGIVVGSDVWIGTEAIILDGVKIGHGAIVGAGAVVTRDVEPFAVVGGVPARLIRYRFDPDVIARLLAVAWWDWSPERVEANVCLFDNVNVFLDSVGRG